MSMRSQVYEWSNLAPATQDFTLRRTTADVPKALTANREYDLFIGGVGLNITKPAETTATQFIVIEDIDTLGGLDRREKGNHPLLGEFLNCLSGVGGNDGVITIATTNYPENLDIALADRPGRFDLRIEFGLPDAHLRKYILEKYLEEVESKNIDLKKIIKGTEGMSGAYLREVIMVSYMISIEKKSVVTQEILNEALNTVRELKNNISVSYGIRKPLEDIYS